MDNKLAHEIKDWFLSCGIRHDPPKSHHCPMCKSAYLGNGIDLCIDCSLITDPTDTETSND